MMEITTPHRNWDMSIVVYFSPQIDRSRASHILLQKGIRAHEMSDMNRRMPESRILVLAPGALDQDSSLVEEARGVLLMLKHESELEGLKLPSHLHVETCVGEFSPAKLQSLIQSVQMRLDMEQMQRERDMHLGRLKQLNSIG